MCRNCMIAYMQKAKCEINFTKKYGDNGKMMSFTGSKPLGMTMEKRFLYMFGNFFVEYCEKMAEYCNMDPDECEKILLIFMGDSEEVVEQDVENSNVEVVHIKAENPKDAIKQIMEVITKQIESRKKK